MNHTLYTATELTAACLCCVKEILIQTLLTWVSSLLQFNFHNGRNLKPSLGFLWENLHEWREVLDSHWSCKAEDKEENMGEHWEAGRNLPVLQQQGHPANLPRLVWWVPGLTQVLPHKAEVPCKDRLHVAEGVKGVLPVVATHATGTYPTKRKSLNREMDNSIIQHQRPRASVVLEILLCLLLWWGINNCASCVNQFHLISAEDVHCQRFLSLVDEIYCFSSGGHSDDWEDRTKNFFLMELKASMRVCQRIPNLHDWLVWADPCDDGGGDVELLLVHLPTHLQLALSGCQQTREPGKVASVNNATQVRTSLWVISIPLPESTIIKRK